MPCQNHPQIDDALVRCAGCAAAFCPDCVIHIGNGAGLAGAGSGAGFGGTEGVALCGPCKTEWLLDRLSGLPATALDLASIWRRFFALVIDDLLVALPAGLVLAIAFYRLAATRGEMPLASQLEIQIASLFTLPLAVLYNGWMLAVRGQTLGKMALGIRVVNADGEPLSPGQAWGRAVLQRLFLSCLALLNYLPAFLTPERTCIHDMAAKTRVIRWQP
jgi:uncharacterized RDD family membrane protein YckC